MEVVEDFESRSHKAVSFVVVRREKEMKEWTKQKLREVLPGYSGGKLPGRSTKEKGREEGGRRGRRRKKDQGSSRSRRGCRHQKEGRRA